MVTRHITVEQRERERTRLGRETETLRREPAIMRDSSFQMWVLSLAAVQDGQVLFSCHYALARTEEMACTLGMEQCQDTYPEEEGYGQHTVAVKVVKKSHLARIVEAIL
jgi:hypothetical protein